MSTHNSQGRGAGTIQHNTEGALKPDNQFDEELAAEMVKRTEKVNDASLDLVTRLKAAREFMAWSNSHLRREWMDWQDQCLKAARDLTQDRMAFDREGKAIIASAKDVRDLFNSDEYLKAHTTLKEMVGLLDRFTTMKKDGTLDAFSDFILKVSCK